MTKFREHGLIMYLSPELYLGFIKLQADRGLGRSFAGLLCFVEGLFKMGYISENVYEAHRRRYSEPLVRKEIRPLTREEKQQERQLEELNKLLGMVIKQWNLHPSREWRDQWIQKAEDHPDLPNAKLILALAKRKSVSHG